MTAETGVGHRVSRRLCKFQIQENLCLLGLSFANRGAEMSVKVFFTSVAGMVCYKGQQMFSSLVMWWNLVSSLWCGNHTTVWNGMTQPHPRKRNQKHCPYSKTIAIVLWDVERLSQRGPSFLLVILRCSRIFFVHYVTYPGKRKIMLQRGNTWAHIAHLCVWWGFRRMVGNFSPFTVQCGHRPIRLPSVQVCKR